MKSFRFSLLIGAAVAFVSCTAKAQELRKVFSVNEDKMEILANFLGGQKDPVTGYVKWEPTISDILDFNGEFGDGALYSKVDTFFTSKDPSGVNYIVFHTISMIEEEGKMTSANYCHMCGVNMGLITLKEEKDSLYFNALDKNFATQGSFGRPEYKLQHIDFGGGEQLIRIDDPYDGMGVESVSTTLYDGGTKILSMISKENNSGARERNQKGYYEFKTDFILNKKDNTITAKQTGFKIDENTGKKVLINKIKKWENDGFTKQF